MNQSDGLANPPAALPPFESVATRVWFLIGYAAALVVTFHFAFGPIDYAASHSVLFSPTAVLIAALLLRPQRRWVEIFAVTLVAAIVYIVWVLGLSVSLALGIVAFNILEAAATAWMLERAVRRPVTFGRLDEIIFLIAISALVNFVVGFAVAAITVPAEGTAVFLRNRWISHGLSNLLITPLLTAWWPQRATPPWKARNWLEFIGCIFLSFVVAKFAFRPGLAGSLPPLPYLAFLPVIIAASRLGPRGAATTMLVISGYAMGALASDREWPTGSDILGRVAMAELFLGVAGITGLVLAASREERVASLERFRQGEHRLRGMFSSSMNPVAICRGTEIELANPALLRLLGVQAEGEVVGKPWPDLVLKSDRPRVAQQLLAAKSSDDGFETEVVRADGTTVAVELRFGPYRAPDETLTIVGVRDLTQARTAARAIARTNRVLITISGCNNALVRATSEAELLAEICRAVAAGEGFLMAWAGMVEFDEAKSVRRVATAGGETGYLDEIRPTWAANDDAEFGDPSNLALRTMAPKVWRQTESDARRAKWAAVAARHGFGSAVALPLVAGDRALGVLCFYSGDPEAFTPDVVNLLREFADNAAYGIRSLRARDRQHVAEEEVRRLLGEADKARTTLLGILEDRELAEKARKQSEERYRNAMFQSAIGMALVAPDGHWLEVNPALCRIVGYSREELLASTFQAISHPEDTTSSLKQMQELLAGTRAAYEIEKRYLDRHGRVIWAHIDGSLVRDPNGKPLHFVAQIQDITARKQAEAALAATVERLAVALRASRLGVWRVNVQNRAVEWDARMFEIFGLPPRAQPLTAEEVLTRVVPEDYARVRGTWDPIPEHPAIHGTRFRITRGDGAIRHLESHRTVYNDAGSVPEWVVGVTGDITDIVEATTESERLRSQLLQAQKMETLGTLAAGVAHDFNNLLTGINGFVELASRTVEPGHEAAELLEQAKNGAMSARDLVRQILDYSRRQDTEEPSQIDLVAVVRETAPLLQAAIPGNVSLDLAVTTEHVPIVGTAGQVQQILMNLATNAAHAMENRSGRIEIGVRTCDLDAPILKSMGSEASPGHFGCLSVADDGCGMDEATLQRIFEPFFTTKPKGKGTGLGLAIVTDIVRAARGAARVTSTVGLGSRFEIYLPLVATEEPEVATPVAAQFKLPAGKVLVVDDESAITLVIAAALSQSGFAVEAFNSPVAAFRAFAANADAYTLLLVDHNMPEMSGAELIDRVRRVKPDIAVVRMTGGSAIPWANADSTRVLRKPFDIAELLEVVRTAVEDASPASQS